MLRLFGFAGHEHLIRARTASGRIVYYPTSASDSRVEVAVPVDSLEVLTPPDTAEIRKVIYTTNAIESLNRSLRKISKNRGVFPHQDSLLKLFYLALERIAKKWTMPIRNWREALNRFAIEFGDRVSRLD